MKKLENLNLSFILVLLICISCTKDKVEVLESFNFEIEERHSQETTINVLEKTTISIIPDKIVSTNVFSYKYEVLVGTGKYLDRDNLEIPENTFIALKDLTLEIFYRSSSILKENVRFTVKDSKGFEKEIELSYHIGHNDFTVDLSSSTEQTTINKLVPFYTELTNNGKDQELNFEREYIIEDGEGFIYDENNEIVEQGIFKPMSSGRTNYAVKFTKAVASTLIMNSKDANGQTKQKILSFGVSPIDFDFRVSSNTSETIVDETVPLDFELIKDTDGTEKYSMTYVTNGNGKFVYRGVEYSPLQTIEIDIIDSSRGFWNGEYTGTSEGNQTIEFTISTDQSQPKTDPVSIEFKTIPKTLDTATFRFTQMARTQDRVENGNTYGKIPLRIAIVEIDYEGQSEIAQIEIDGIEFNINDVKSIGYIDYIDFLTNDRTCVQQMTDANVTIKKNRMVEVRVRNNDGVLSNTIMVQLPEFYLGPRNGCRINDCAANCRY